VRRGEEK
jgi:hypothetical protein